MHQKLIITALLFNSLLALGSADPNFVLVKLEPLPPAEYKNLGNGGPVSPYATLDVTYPLQPCADQYFDQFIVTQSGEPGDRQMRVGVLIHDSGLICKGPTILETKTVTFQGAFNLPGEMPTIKPLKFVD